MKALFLILFFSTSVLFAQTAPFASQSDLVADLSDTVLDGVYHHRLGFERDACERSFWLEAFGNCRKRDHYKDWFGGGIIGFNYSLSYETYLNFFLGGSLGKINIAGETDFDTDSLVFGMSWEQLCDNNFFGLVIAGGYLSEERTYLDVHEEPRGVFLTPELTYAYRFSCMPLQPIFTSDIRYAGFFSREYEHHDSGGTLHVEERSIQLITLRSELAFPCFCCLQFYGGGAGRFQFDGKRVEGRIGQNEKSFSDGIDHTIGYGFLGLRLANSFNSCDLSTHIEGGYDTDASWRILGDISLNFMY